MDYSDVRENLNNGKYNVVYKDDPRPEVLRDGFITDRQQSVAWNEEQVAQSKRNLKNWHNRRTAAEQRARDSFESDLIEAIKDDAKYQGHPFTDEQASIIYSESYDSGHAYGYSEVLNYASSNTDTFVRFLKAGNA